MHRKRPLSLRLKTNTKKLIIKKQTKKIPIVKKNIIKPIAKKPAEKKPVKIVKSFDYEESNYKNLNNGINITHHNHYCVRMSIVNNDVETLEKILQYEPYSKQDINILLDNEMLKDTIDHFASDSIMTIINNHFSI